jgi:hypothetical protein
LGAPSNPTLSKSTRIALVAAQGRPVTEVLRVLRSVADDVSMESSVVASTFLDDTYDLVVVDHDLLTPEAHALLVSLQREKRRRLLLLSSGSDKARLGELFASGVLSNLVARNDVVDPEELLVTVQKLLRRDIFGIEKYFGWGCNMHNRRIVSARDRFEMVDQATEFAKRIGVHPRLAAMFRTAADELITNAIFDAPTDGDGNYRFAHLARGSDVRLSPAESIEVTFSCDGRRLGISTVDPFGSIAQERLMHRLAEALQLREREVNEHSGGAGLGLFFVYDSLSHFIVNIRPGSRTEMIGIVNIEASYKQFIDRSKSFNLFVDSDEVPFDRKR